MRKLARTAIRTYSTTKPFLQSTPTPPPPSPKYAQEILNSIAHAKLTKHPQAPLPTRGVGPFTRNAKTGERLTFKQREEEKAKEYLYEQPDPNIPLPPLLLKPPGLVEAPVKGEAHGKETRTWWQREFEIWFGRYQKPFDVQAQLNRHKTMNSYNTEWSPKADRRSVRKTHGKFFMSPHALFRSDKAKYAPNFTGQSIAPEGDAFESVTFAAERKATVVGLFSTQMAYRMCRPYLEAIESAFPLDPSVGVVRVQFEENWAKMMLLQYYIKSRFLRPLYTSEQQKSYILSRKFVNRVEGEATHITNTQVGYVLLLDDKSRIRWMATGMPWPGELDALRKGVAKLIGQDIADFEDVEYDD